MKKGLLRQSLFLFWDHNGLPAGSPKIKKREHRANVIKITTLK